MGADDTDVFDSDATCWELPAVLIVSESELVTAKVGDEFPIDLPPIESLFRFDAQSL